MDSKEWDKLKERLDLKDDGPCDDCGAEDGELMYCPYQVGMWFEPSTDKPENDDMITYLCDDCAGSRQDNI